MDGLYVLGQFDTEGKFEEYVRKGRNKSISGYDNLTAAKRGLAQSRNNRANKGKVVKIMKAHYVEVLEY